MINESESIWKEAVVALSRYYPGHLLGETEETLLG
jgi:hypothetical protein